VAEKTNKKRLMVLTHGIFNREKSFQPGRGMQRLVPYVEAAGFETLPIFYGFFGILRVITGFPAGPVAHTFASFVIELSILGYEVHGAGHSHGARVLALASEYAAPFRTLTFINGAVDKTVKIGQQVETVFNYYVRSDPLLGIAAVLPWNPMGNAGKLGLQFIAGGPQRVNGNLTEICGATGHSDWDEDGKVEKFARAWMGDLSFFAPARAAEAT